MLPAYGLLIALLLLTPLRLGAQESIGSEMSLAHPGQMVRIKTQDGQLVEGHLSDITPARPGVQLKDRGALPLGDIDSLWVRGTRAKSGAILGGLVFGIASGAVWSAICNVANDGAGCDAGGTVAALTLAGAGAGAGLGALIGSASPRWRLRYARPGLALRLHRFPDRVGLGVAFRLPLPD